MRLVFMGPPGVGKGTQAKRLKTHYKIVHLSTGDILREEINTNTRWGVEAKVFMNDGQLVPDDLILEMMNNRLRQDDCMEGYLLDGFPRTLPQAQGLDFILEDLNQSLNRSVNLTADSDELIRRLILRGQKSGRDDDSPDVIRKRQQVYWDQTAPLIDYYRKQQILIEVNGIGEISEITHRIIKSLT